MSRQTEFDAVMDRIKNLSEYEVQVTVPEDFQSPVFFVWQPNPNFAVKYRSMLKI